MHENASIREWLAACGATVKLLFKSVLSIPCEHAVNIENELSTK